MSPASAGLRLVAVHRRLRGHAEPRGRRGAVQLMLLRSAGEAGHARAAGAVS